MEVTQPVHIYSTYIHYRFSQQSATCAGIQCCAQIKENAMKAHDITRDDYIYEHDKPVYVRSYCRIRYGELEHVTDHYRSYPIR